MIENVIFAPNFINMLYRSVILPYVKILQEFPEEPVLLIEDKLVTNALFAKRLASIVNELESQPEEVVALLVEDELDTFAAVVAALIAGKTLLPIRAHWSDEQRGKILSMFDVKSVLTAARMHYYYYMTFENALDRLDSGMETFEDGHAVALMADFDDCGRPVVRKISAAEICPEPVRKRSRNVKTIQPGTPLYDYFTILQLNHALLSQQA